MKVWTVSDNPNSSGHETWILSDKNGTLWLQTSAM